MKGPTLAVPVSQALLDQLLAATSALDSSRARGRPKACPDLQSLVIRLSVALRRDAPTPRQRKPIQVAPSVAEPPLTGHG